MSRSADWVECKTKTCDYGFYLPERKVGNTHKSNNSAVSHVVVDIMKKKRKKRRMKCVVCGVKQVCLCVCDMCASGRWTGIERDCIRMQHLYVCVGERLCTH